MSAFVSQTAVMCKIQNCNDGEIGSCEEEEPNA